MIDERRWIEREGSCPFFEVEYITEAYFLALELLLSSCLVDSPALRSRYGLLLFPRYLMIHGHNTLRGRLNYTDTTFENSKLFDYFVYSYKRIEVFAEYVACR